MLYHHTKEMLMLRPLVSTAALIAAMPALADVPRVATDIAPVHSLTAMVMGDLGEPTLLIEPGSSPHTAGLRPSQAKALSQADLVVWIGEKLSPQVGHQIEVLGQNAKVLELLELPESVLLDFQESAVFEDHHDEEGHDAHGHDDHDDHKDHGDHGHDDDHKDHDDHAHEEHGHDEHKDHDDHGHEDGHKDHDDHAHEEHKGEHGHDSHAEEGHDDHAGHDDHHDHDHTGLDPHIWLSTDNAKLWIKAIALELGQLDPENAEVYNQNAAIALDRVEAAYQEAAQTLASVKSEPLAVAHDAFQYYDHTFDLNILGAISDVDDAAPGPARLAALQAHFEATAMPACFLGNPGQDTRLIEAAAGSNADFSVAVINPLGTDLDLGADLYPALITGIATSIAECVNR
jgi:zinc transport system substrate-binding protein